MQATLPSGKRVYIEYDRSTSSRGIPHADRIFSNDKDAIVILRTLLSTKVEAELKLGPWNNSAAIQGGRQYPDNQASSLYRGGEVKSVVKPQLGIGGMLKWDIWNGRSKRYEKIR